MLGGLDEDATTLAPRRRALGIVPALVFVFAVVGLKSVGVPANLTGAMLASLLFTAAVAVIGGVLGDGMLGEGAADVNLVQHAPAALGASSGPLWWLVLVVVVAVVAGVGGVHVGAARAFGTPVVAGAARSAGVRDRPGVARARRRGPDVTVRPDRASDGAAHGRQCGRRRSP